MQAILRTPRIACILLQSLTHLRLKYFGILTIDSQSLLLKDLEPIIRDIFVMIHVKIDVNIRVKIAFKLESLF